MEKKGLSEKHDDRDLKEEPPVALDKKRMRLLNSYANAPELRPPDKSLQGGSQCKESQVFNQLSALPIEGPAKELWFLPFKVNPWDVPTIVREWVNSWYRVPSDFAKCAIIPPHFARVLVPHAVFSIKASVFVSGLEEHDPIISDSSQERRLHLPYPAFGTVSVTSQSILCSATSVVDCKFYDDAWSTAWNLEAKKAFHPDTDFGYLAPPDQCHSVGLNFMQEEVRAEQESSKQGLLESLWSAITGPSSPPNPQELTLPGDAYMLPTLSTSDVWVRKRSEIEESIRSIGEQQWRFGALAEHRRTCSSSLLQKIDYSSEIVYMPVYSGTYTYAGKTFRIAINGQNGNVVGDRPTGTFGDFVRNVFSWF